MPKCDFCGIDEGFKVKAFPIFFLQSNDGGRHGVKKELLKLPFVSHPYLSLELESFALLLNRKSSSRSLTTPLKLFGESFYLYAKIKF